MSAKSTKKWSIKLLASFILGVSFVFIALALMGKEDTQKVLATTAVPPVINSDTVWEPGPGGINNPFIITGTVLVQAELTISPGVEVQFGKDGQLQIGNNGELLALGTALNPITFTSRFTQAMGTWDGIRFTTDSNGGTVRYALIEYSKVGLALETGQTYIVSNNTFRFIGDSSDPTASGGIIGSPDNSMIQYNTIYSSVAGIQINEVGNDAIRNNVIYDISQNCISILPGGASSSNNVLAENNVYNCGLSGIRIDDNAGGVSNDIIDNLITNTNISSNINSGAIYLNNQLLTLMTGNLIYDIPSANGSGLLISGTVNLINSADFHSNAICVDGQYEVESRDTTTTIPAGGNWTGTNTPTSPPQYSTNVNINPPIILTATAVSPTLSADGVSTTDIVITMNDGAGHTVPPAARVIDLATSLGTLSAPSVTLNANGVATVTLTAPTTFGTAIISATEFCNYLITTTVEFQAADLDISKTSALTQVLPGGLITYTVTYTNEGNIGADNVVITDTLPANTTWFSDDAVSQGFTRVPVNPTSIVEWRLGTVPSNTVNTITVVAQVDDFATIGCSVGGVPLTNQVAITSSTTNGGSGNTTYADVNGVTIACPDVTISKTGPGGAVQVGDTITYTIVYSNIGDAPAHNVVITDVNPVSGTIDTLLSGITLNPGQQGSILYAVTTDASICANAGGVLTNTAFISTSDPETDTTNNSATADAGTGAPTINCYNLAITKTTAISWAVPGQTITYTIAYTNDSDYDAPGVIISDVLPISTTYVSDSSGFPTAVNGAGSVVTWTVGAVPAHSGGSFILTATIAPSASLIAPTYLTNTVYIAGAGGEQDTSDNSDTAVIYIQNGVNLTADKTDNRLPGDPALQAGDLITYTIQVQNLGNEPATNIVLSDTLPANTSFVGITGPNGWFQVGSTSLYTYNVGTLNFQESASIDFIVQIDPGLPCSVTQITNTVTVGSDEADLDPPDNSDTTAPTPVVCVPPTLAISKTTSTIWTVPGRTITYTIEYFNTGPGTAGSAIITDALPISTTFTSSTLPISSNVGGIITWDLGDIPPNSGGSFDLSITIDPTLACTANLQLINSAYIWAVNLLPGSSSATSSAAIDVLCGVDLSVIKNDNIGTGDPITTAVAGGYISYTVQVRNGGSEPAHNVVLTETLPAGTSFVGPVGPDGWLPLGGTMVLSAGTYIYNVGTLDPGFSFEVEFVVRVDPSLSCAVTEIVNTVETGSSEADLDYSNNIRHEQTPVECLPLILSKTDGNLICAVPGQQIDYRISITNNLTSTVASQILTEYPDPNTSFLGIPVQWAGPNPYTRTVNSIPAGGSFSSLFSVLVSPSIPVSVTSITNVVRLTPAGLAYTLTTPINHTAPDLFVVKNDNIELLPKLDEIAYIEQKTGPLEILEALKPKPEANKVQALYVQPGDVISYSIAWGNASGNLATGVVITETIPENTTFIGPNYWQHVGGRTYIYTGTPTVGPGFPAVPNPLNLYVQVNSPFPVGTPGVTNTVQIASDALIECDISDNISMEFTRVISDLLTSDSLVITKTSNSAFALPGDTISYTISYENQGTSTALSAVITDALPISATFASSNPAPSGNNGSVITWTLGDLAPGASGSIILTVTIDSALDCTLNQDLLNTAYLSALNLPPGSSSASSTSAIDIRCPIELVKTDGNLICAAPGQFIDYRIAITNNSVSATGGLLLTEFPDPNTTFQGIPTAWNGSNPYTRSVSSLAPNSSFSSLFNVLVNPTIPASVNAITNVVTLSPLGLAYTLTTPINHTAPDLFVVKNDNIELLPKEKLAEMARVEQKTGPLEMFEALRAQNNKVQATYVRPGDIISYTIAWGNASNNLATGVVITETIPENTTFIGPNLWAHVGGRTYVYNIGNVGPGYPIGAPNPLRIYVRVDNPFPAGTPGVTNTVQIASDALIECDISDNISMEFTRVFSPVISGTVYLPIVMVPEVPDPYAQLVWVHQNDDLVQEVDGSNPNAFVPDGRNDGLFMLTVNTGQTDYTRVINRLVMTSTQTNSVLWDTPVNGIPIMGVYQGAARLNAGDGSINQSLTTQDVYALYLSDDAGLTRFVCDPPLYQYTVGVYFEDGSSAQATATIPDCSPPPTPTPTPTPQPLAWVSDVAADPTTNQIFIASPREDAVHVISGTLDTYDRPVPVGNGPTGLAVMTSTVPSKVAVAHAYALNDWNPGAWYINTQNLTAQGRPDEYGYVGAAPVRVTANSNTRRFFYSNYFDRMPIVDGVFERRLDWVFKKNFQASYGIEAHQQSDLVYMAAIDTGELIIFDTIAAEANPGTYGACHNAPPDNDGNGDADPRIMRQIAVNPATGHIFVSSPPDPNPDNGQFDSRVYVLDEATLLDEAGGRPSDITCTWNFLKTGQARPPFKRVPNARPGKGWISTITLNGASSPGSNRPSPGAGVEGITVNPRTGKVYLTDSYANKLFILQDGPTPSYLGVITSGFDNPQGVDVNIETNKIYVANARSDSAPYGTVTVIDGDTDTVLYIVPLSGSAKTTPLR